MGAGRAMFRLGAAVLVASWLCAPALAESSMVPKKAGSACPSGSADAGGGYCRGTAGQKFVEKRQGSTCPSGTSDAGGGYCRLR